MARYIREERINKPNDFVDFIMSDFLQKHGFRLNTLNGESIWQDGTGWLVMPRFFKYWYQDGIIHLEAWMRYPILPGVYLRENDLRGFIGSVPKSAYRNDIENLIQVLYQPLQQDNMYGYAQNYAGNQNFAGNPQYNGMPGQPGMPMNMGGPITVKGVDTSNLVKVGFIFSLGAIPFTFLNSWLGILWGSIGVLYCYKSLKSSKKGLAQAGFIIGLAGLLFAIGKLVLEIIELLS